MDQPANISVSIFQSQLVAFSFSGFSMWPIPLRSINVDCRFVQTQTSLEKEFCAWNFGFVDLCLIAFPHGFELLSLEIYVLSELRSSRLLVLHTRSNRITMTWVGDSNVRWLIPSVFLLLKRPCRSAFQLCEFYQLDYAMMCRPAIPKLDAGYPEIIEDSWMKTVE